MGLSSSKTKTTQDQNTQQSGTTMPITPPWLTEAAQDYVGRIGDFGDMDPNQFIAGASPLQRQAWGNADQLGGWRPQANMAAGMAAGAGMAGPNTAGRYHPPTGGELQPQTSQPVMQPSMGKADPRVGPQVAQGQSGGQPGLVSPQGYSAAPSDPGYAMPRQGHPIGYQPPPGVDPNPAITGASQAGAYQNPFQQQVIDTSLAGYDQNVGQQQAQMAANAARNGAFGGSRYGLAEGQFGADSALGRGQLESGLRSQGFQYANQMGMQDAAAGNNMLQFDAQQRDNAQNRALQAAGLLQQGAGQYAGDTRADLATMSGLGEQQRGIEQAYAGAPLAQLQMMGQLSGMTPYQILVGNQVDSTGQMHGTNVTSQSPSLFQSLLSGASSAAMFL